MILSESSKKYCIFVYSLSRQITMQNSLKWGALSAGIGILIALIMFLAGISLNPDLAWARWVGFIGALVVLFMGVREKKMEDPASFTFGKGWSATLMISIVAGLISAVWLFVYAGYIEPEMIDMTLATQRAAMMQNNMNREQMEQAMKYSSMFISPGGIAVTTLISYIIGGMLLGLIISPIVKATGNKNIESTPEPVI